jgi:hypothetical protein
MGCDAQRGEARLVPPGPDSEVLSGREEKALPQLGIHGPNTSGPLAALFMRGEVQAG